MKIVLMGLEFFINNLGCEALSYSFVSELYSLAKTANQELDISTIVFADQKIPYIPGRDLQNGSLTLPESAHRSLYQTVL